MRKVITGLVPGATYGIQVRAVNGTNVSAWSRTFVVELDSDQLAPKAPTALTGRTVGDSFQISWAAVTLNEDNTQIRDLKEYVVEMTHMDTMEVVQTSTVDNKFELTYNMNDAQFSSPAKAITFRVAAVDMSNNWSEWSTPLLLVNLSPDPVENLYVESILDGLDISFDPPSNFPDDFLEYRAYIGTTAGFEPDPVNMIWRGVATRFQYMTTTQTDMYIKVTVADKLNNESTDVTFGPVRPRSSTAVDTDAPGPPGNLAGTISGDKLTVTWTAPANPDNDLAGYQIEYRPVGETVWSSAPATHEDTSRIIQPIVPFVNYQVRMRAHDFTFNYSTPTSTITVNGAVNVAPAVPTGVDVAGGMQSAMVRWNAVADADLKEYEVQFSDVSPTSDTVPVPVKTNSTILSFNNLDSNKVYYARVRAVDTGGLKSAWSSIASDNVGIVVVDLTDGNPPASSPTPTARAGASSIFATWPAVANNDLVTYEVHLGTTTGFTPAAGTKVGETVSTFTTIQRLPNGDPIVPGTNYYVKLIAKDDDGAAAAGAASNGVSTVYIPTAQDIDDKFETSIIGSQIEYAVNSSETVAPTSGWSTAQPTRNPGQFIWFRTVITYGDNTTNTSSAALLTGNTGAPGSAGTPAKTIALNATTQVLTEPATGGATTPATAVVTGTATNTTITTWEYSVDGGTFTTTVPAGVSRSTNTVTITGATMTARTIAVRASDGATASDTLTVAKVSHGAKGDTGNTGAPGADAYTVLLTNEAHDFPGGTSAAIAGSTTSDVLGFKGGTQMPVTVGTITGQVTGLTTAVTNNGTNTPTITVTVTTSLTARNGILTIPVTIDGVTFTKNMSWSVNRTGATGAAGPSVSLAATTQVLAHSAGSSTTDPATSIVTGTVSGTTIGSWQYSVNGGAFSTTRPAYVSAPASNSVTVTGATMTDRTVAIRAIGAITTATDTVTIAKVSDGATGSTGPTGPAGADAYTVLLTNESHAFPGDVNNALAGSTTSGLLAYKGSTQVPVTIGTISGQVTGLTTSIQNNGTNTAQFTVTVTTALTATNGKLTVPVTVDGVSFTKEFSWSVARKGSQGIQGPPGADGTERYTWLKYADTATPSAGQMYDDPTGRLYMGLAVNKTSPTESTNYLDYSWSLIKGEQGNQGIQGPPGTDGQTTYTWVKYADNASGAGMSDDPTGKAYIGLAYNKLTQTESSTAGDYQWAKILGDQGPAGADAKTISMTATTQVLSHAAATPGTTSPATSVVTAVPVNTTVTTWTYSVDGGSFTSTKPTYVSTPSGNSVTVTGSTMSNKTVAIKAADAAGNSDSVTIAKVSDGATGSTGTPGTPGADAYTVLLTNEAHAFAGDVNNALAGSTTSQVIAYKGATQIAATIGTITGQVTGLTTSIQNNGTTTAQFTVTVTTALTATSGKLTVPLTVDGKSFTKEFAWSVARKGATGSTGAAGTGISGTEIRYQVHTNGTTAPTGTWLSTIPATSPGQFLWTRTVTSYTDSSSSTAYAVAAHGATGATGVGVTGTVVNYAKNTSGTTAPTTGWGTSIPATTTGEFLWTRTVTSYSSGPDTTAYSVAAHGATGATGSTGAPGADAKSVSLTASTQVLTHAAATPTVTTPATSVVTATAVNTTVTVWQYAVDGGSFSGTKPAYVSTPSGNSVTVTGSSMTNKTVSIRAADASGNADVVTIAKVSDGATGSTGSTGAPGADAYTVLLGNEAHTFPGSTSAAIAGNTVVPVIAFKGATQIAATIGTITGQVTGLTTTIQNNGTTTAQFTVAVTTSLTTQAGVLTVPVTVDGQTFSKRFSWSVSRTGATGNTGSPGTPGVSVTAVTPFFRTVTAGAAAPAQPTGTGDPAGWTTTEPAWTANTDLYRTERISYSNSTATWTPVTKVSTYEAAAIAITADKRVQSAERAPNLTTDVANAPIGALFYEYGAATSPGSGTVLKQTYIYNGSTWQPRGIDRTFLPQVDIGSGTFGDLAGNRLVANSVTSNEINTGDLAANTGFIGTLLGTSAFFDNVTVKAANITGSLTIGKVSGLQSALDAKATPDDIRNATNLIDNPTKLNSVGRWNSGTLAISNEDFFGDTIPVLKSTSTGSTQHYSSTFATGIKVDITKAYEVRLWYKDPVLVPSTQFYLGLNAYTAAGATANVTSVNATTGIIGSTTNNAYFYSTSSNTPEWKELVAYILPYGIENGEVAGLGKNVSSHFMMEPDVNTVRIRFLNWSNTGTARDVFIAHASVTEVSMETIRQARAAAQAAADQKALTDGWKMTGKTTINGGAIEADTIGAVQIKTAELYADSAWVTNLFATAATIGTVDADFMKAGFATATTMVVKSTLTLGDASSDGIIQSHGYVANTTGFRLTKNTLDINQGTISAQALQLQVGQNLVPVQYSGFEFPASSYAHMQTANGAALIQTSGAKYNKQHMRIDSTNTSQTNIYLADTDTDYNIPLEPGKQYILSAWFKGTGSGVTTAAALVLKGTNGAEIGTLSRTVTQTDQWDRYWTTITVPAGVTGGLLIARINTASASAQFDIDGIQLEEKTSASSDPSTWNPGTNMTMIDGGMVRTGEIRSTADGPISGQPMWSINMTGGAQFGSALVRGVITVGTAGGEAASGIQSANYVAGSTGWRVDGAGNGEFNTLKIGNTQIQKNWITTNGLYADYIVAGNLNVTLTLTANGLIRTAATGARTELTNPGMKIYNDSNQVILDATGGSIDATGTFYARTSPTTTTGIKIGPSAITGYLNGLIEFVPFASVNVPATIRHLEGTSGTGVELNGGRQTSSYTGGYIRVYGGHLNNQLGMIYAHAGTVEIGGSISREVLIGESNLDTYTTIRSRTINLGTYPASASAVVNLYNPTISIRNDSNTQLGRLYRSGTAIYLESSNNLYLTSGGSNAIYMDGDNITGEWTSWTPSLTPGSGTINYGSGSTRYGRYKKMGKMVWFNAMIQWGGTGRSTGSGFYSFNLPIAAESAAWGLVQVHVVSTPVIGGEGFGSGKLESGSTGINRLYVKNSTGGTHTLSGSNSWGQNDRIFVSGFYEVS